MNLERVLVSGGSGLIGSSVIRALDANSISCVQLIRQTNRANLPKKEPAVTWDPLDPNPVQRPEFLEGIDAAIHLSGANVAAHRWTPAYRQEILTSRVQTTQALVGVLTSLRRRPSVLLCASATGIYGNRGDTVLSEDSPPGTGFLATVCQQWEAAAQTAQAAGIRVVCLRFGVVLTPSGGALARMLPLFRLCLGGRMGSGRQWMSWVTLRDAVRIVLHALGNQSLTGPLNVVAPAPSTNAEFTRALAHTLHRPAFAAAPAFALRLALGAMADEALLASARAVPARLTQAGFRFQDVQIEPALHSMLQPGGAAS